MECRRLTVRRHLQEQSGLCSNIQRGCCIDGFLNIIATAPDLLTISSFFNLINIRKIHTGNGKLKELTADGLTSVREGDSRFYLMDNIEVLACYQDIQCLGDRLKGFDEISKEAGERAEETSLAIREKIWNPEAFRYEVGIQAGGKVIEAKELDRFYPDGVAQIYGAVFGKYLTGKDDAEKLYERFCHTFSWETMELDGVTFYWSELAMAAERGDLERAEIYLDTYETCMEDGRNVLSVEIHQSNNEKSDIYFSFPVFSLLEDDAAEPDYVMRRMWKSQGMKIRWK